VEGGGGRAGEHLRRLAEDPLLDDALLADAPRAVRAARRRPRGPPARGRSGPEEPAPPLALALKGRPPAHFLSWTFSPASLSSAFSSFSGSLSSFLPKMRS